MAHRGFWQELKRRHVYRVAAAYAFVGWLLIQVATQVFPVFHLPDWIDQAVVLLILIGFPIALVLAWAFDATPYGIVRTDTEGGADSRAPQHSHRAVITVGLIGVLVAVAAGAVWWHAERGGVAAPVAQDKASALSDAKPSLASTAAGVSAVKPRVIPVPPIAAQPIPAKSIAVLPFENLSEDKGNAYFADGMQDLILTKLAVIGDLKVISRTSTEKYQSHPDNLKIIAQQLGVATILEGSVQKAGNQVLINVQLIDAHSDNHLWAESYTRTLDNIFGVEGEVAQKVADALQARLTNVEQQNVAAIPTQNPAAYDWFLKAEYQANKAFDSQDAGDFKLAEDDYRHAIALDPGFALAYVRLAYWQMARHWYVAPLTDRELAEVKATIDHTLAIDPDLPDAHLALGFYYYWGYRRYADAGAQFERVLQLAPNNVQALGGLAFIDRRRGRWPQALATLKQALLISPRDAYLLGQYGWTLCIVRRYREAERQLSRALAIEPGKTDNQDGLWRTRLIGMGDAPGARKANDPLPGWRLDTHENIAAGEIVALINPIVYPDVFERNFDAALRAWDAAPVDTDAEQLTRRVARVAIEIIAGRQPAIQSECAQLKPPLEAELAKHPDAIRNLQQVAWVDVCLGRNADAISAARRMSEEMPLSTDAFFGAYALAGLAEVEAHAGAKDQALQLIDQLMAIPAGEVMSVTRLKLDPVWDPLRGDLRFQALLKKYAAAQPVTGASGGSP